MKRVYEIPELKIERFDMDDNVCVLASLNIVGGEDDLEERMRNRDLQNLYDAERVLK